MKPGSAWVDDRSAPLLTDLYQLAMMQAYWREGMREEAVFSLVFRRLPEERNYALACGLDEVLRYLETLHFDAPAIEALRRLDLPLERGFLEWLRDFRFRGEVHALAEGTAVFPEVPLLEVVAPIAEAQLVESFLMNQMHVQTVLASKASRLVQAAAGRKVVDFGMRRMHGADAAMKGARAYYAAGIDATSNVLAALAYDIPAVGTMAHSYVEAHASEAEAFRAFARSYPETTLLVDTYDSLEGVRTVVRLARELGAEFRVSAIRLDSGDLATLACESRRLLDEAGLQSVEIFASGGLDEWRIAELVAAGAPIDGFGVGTRLGVSRDAPDLDLAYKLTAYAGTGRLKSSPGKRILPGRKQVFRIEEGGRSRRDVVARAGEELPGRPLLEPVMRDGRRLPAGNVSLDRIRARARAEIASLPPEIRALEPASRSYPVELSAALEAYHRETLARVAG